MAKVICVRAFGDLKPGDISEVPDGSTVSPFWFAPADENQDVKTITTIEGVSAE